MVQGRKNRVGEGTNGYGEKSVVFYAVELQRVDSGDLSDDVSWVDQSGRIIWM